MTQPKVEHMNYLELANYSVEMIKCSRKDSVDNNLPIREIDTREFKRFYTMRPKITEEFIFDPRLKDIDDVQTQWILCAHQIAGIKSGRKLIHDLEKDTEKMLQNLELLTGYQFNYGGTDWRRSMYQGKWCQAINALL